jgi:hypothetical protein
MEEQDKRTEQEDVEGHRGSHFKPQASEDATKDEGETEDVEAHRKHHQPQAEDTPKDEGDSDDFELHRKAHKAL